MFNDFIMWRLGKARQKELLEEAAIQRLLKESKSGRPRLRDRFLPDIGDRLISWGLKLKERQKPIL